MCAATHLKQEIRFGYAWGKKIRKNRLKQWAETSCNAIFQNIHEQVATFRDGRVVRNIEVQQEIESTPQQKSDGKSI